MKTHILIVLGFLMISCGVQGEYGKGRYMISITTSNKRIEWNQRAATLNFSVSDARLRLLPVLEELDRLGKLGSKKHQFIAEIDLRRPRAIVGDSYFYTLEKYGIRFEGFYFDARSGRIEYRRSKHWPKLIPEKVDPNIFEDVYVIDWAGDELKIEKKL